MRRNERMQGTQCGLEEPCTVEAVCTVRWGGERSDALSLPDKPLPLSGRVSARVAARSRPRQAPAEPAAVALRAPSLGLRAVLTRSAAPLAPRPAQAASCFDCSGTGTRYGSFFFTIAQARCNNLRAVAHRATLLGFPAARKR